MGRRGWRTGRVRLSAFCVTAASALMLAGCGGGPDVDVQDLPPGVAALYKKAKDEKKISVYTTLDTQSMDGLVEAFKDTYGLDVEYFRANSGELTERIRNENGQGVHKWDAVLHNTQADVDDFAKQGLLTKLTDVPNFKNFPAKAKNGDQSVLVGYNLYGLVWNTTQVKGADVPKTFGGLLNRKFKGLISGPSPRQSLNYTWLYKVARDGAKTGDYVSRLKANGYKVLDNFAEQQIAAGEMRAGFGTQSQAAELKKQGAPIDFAMPDPSVGPARTAAVSAKAPAPNGARLFLDFMLSKKGQRVLDKDVTSPLTGIKDTIPLPPGYRPLDPKTAAKVQPSISSDLGA